MDVYIVCEKKIFLHIASIHYVQNILFITKYHYLCIGNTSFNLFEGLNFGVEMGLVVCEAKESCSTLFLFLSKTPFYPKNPF